MPAKESSHALQFDFKRTTFHLRSFTFYKTNKYNLIVLIIGSVSAKITFFTKWNYLYAFFLMENAGSNSKQNAIRFVEGKKKQFRYFDNECFYFGIWWECWEWLQPTFLYYWRRSSITFPMSYFHDWIWNGEIQKAQLEIARKLWEECVTRI